MHTRTRNRILAVATLALTPLAAFAAVTDPLHPLGSTTLSAIIGKFIGAFLSLLGTVSLVMFIYGGVMYMTAAGNDKQVELAKKTFTRAIIGLFVSFGSYAILRFVLGTVIQTGLSK